MFLKRIKAKSLSALLALLSVTSFTVVEVGAAAPNKRDTGILMYGAKDYRGAASTLDEYMAATNNRDYYGAYYAALAYQQLGNIGKARTYYRMVYSLAPTTQIGGYARDILLKLDPSFAVTLAQQGAAKGGQTPSSEHDLARAIVNLPSSEKVALDRSIPAECRIPFTKAWNGIGVNLDGFVDGRPIKFKFDTGAPDVVFGKNHLKPLGIPDPTGKPDGATGGSSSSEKVDFWMVPATIKVGPIERRIQVMVMEYDHSEPLLGQTFFSPYDCNIDSSSSQINFRQKALASNSGMSGAAISVPFEFREAGSRIIVKVEVNGKTIPAMFDTGNTASALSFMSPKQAASAGIRIPEDAHSTTHIGVNGAGACKEFPISKLKMGPIEKYNISISVNEETAADMEEPLLGQPFWEGYEYSIDRKKNVIHFVRR